MPDVQIAESSPAPVAAPETTPAATPAPSDYRQRLDALKPGTDEFKEWKRTGKLPEPKTSEATSQNAKPARTAAESEPAADDHDGEGADDKHLTPEQRSQRDKANNARRWNKTQRELGAKDARIADLERQLAEKGTKAEAAPAKPEKAQKASAAAPRPKLTDFTNQIGKKFDSYEDAVEAHGDALADWKYDERERQKVEADRQKTEAAGKQEVADAENEIRTKFQERSDAMREKHENFDTIAFSEKLPLNEAAVHFVTKRDLGLEVLYELGKDLKNAERIMGLDPFDTIAELKAIEAKLTPPPVKTATDAPPPPANVGGRAAAVDDPLAVALKNKDWNAVNKLRNERDLKKRAGSRPN